MKYANNNSVNLNKTFCLIDGLDGSESDAIEDTLREHNYSFETYKSYSDCYKIYVQASQTEVLNIISNETNFGV